MTVPLANNTPPLATDTTPRSNRTLPLSDNIALVTGASRGIGRAIARRLAADGAHVLVHYNRSADHAATLVDEIADAGGSAEAIGADLEQIDAVDRLIAEVHERLGERKLDILVNNAGIVEFLDFAHTDPKTLDRLLAVNIRAPYQLTAGLVDRLAPDARVLFVSSIVAATYFPGVTAYAITKGAIDTLTRFLAAELGERGIRVNAIAPGAIDTDMSAWLRSDDGAAQAHSMQALKRIGQPEDIANVAAFLAGPDSNWVTGQIVNASGGSKL